VMMETTRSFETWTSTCLYIPLWQHSSNNIVCRNVS
jgi:hypothetical protein